MDNISEKRDINGDAPPQSQMYQSPQPQMYQSPQNQMYQSPQNQSYQNYAINQPNQVYGYPQQIAQSQYGQGMQPNILVINQPIPNRIVVANMAKIGTSPFSCTCIFCGVPITTSVETSCNCCACLLCCWTGFLLYACIQICSGRDICCCDAIHRCPNCKRVVGTYSAL